MKKHIFKPFLAFVVCCFILTFSLSLFAEKKSTEPDLSDSSSGSTEVAQVEEKTVPSGDKAFQAVYSQGSAPFKKNAKIKITKSGDSFIFVPTRGDAWSLTLKQIRGAVQAKTGMWFYWFDANNNTLSGFFRIKGRLAELVGSINSSVNDYFQSPGRLDQKYKADYEAYKKKALREAK